MTANADRAGRRRRRRRPGRLGGAVLDVIRFSKSLTAEGRGLIAELVAVIAADPAAASQLARLLRAERAAMATLNTTQGGWPEPSVSAPASMLIRLALAERPDAVSSELRELIRLHSGRNVRAGDIAAQRSRQRRMRAGLDCGAFDARTLATLSYLSRKLGAAHLTAIIHAVGG